MAWPSRPLRLRKGRWTYRNAVVCSGGGNAGAAQIGMLRSLLAAGVEPDLFVGCSVGALNATYMASEAPTQARVDGLEAVWRSIDTADVFAGTKRSIAAHLIRRDDHVYEAAGLQALIKGAIPMRDLSHSAIPVHIVTTDLRTGVPAWWSTGDPVEVLCASACLPGLFPPVGLGGSLHVDGGVLCPVPTERALALGAERVWVLDVSGTRVAQLPDKPTAFDILVASFAIARRALQEAPIEVRPGQQITVISVDLPANLDVRDFSKTSELIAAGSAAAEAALAAPPLARAS